MTPEQISQVSRRARCLYSESAVERALDNMVTAISAKIGASNPIVLCVMNGGLITTGKLAMRLDFPLQLDYLHATRYREHTSGSDQLHWEAYPKLGLTDRVVLVVDDILDQGLTLERVLSYCREQGAAAVYVAVLIDKMPARKLSSVTADFVGLEIGDDYVFGYGMDYKGYLRNAAGIFAVAKQDR
ncbi:MAG TPA: hypoxanthine-guanine phosphoribosyltransferase [Gammaproteobacteria bacterium]|nr:hypoxanthine-guanine phosphoribosyltransferase [Gammaproteobacteria bacterium]HIL63310.1 hypoxanthine-guanine phosphoribosyltransferase [Porticoccaceae bacterium]